MSGLFDLTGRVAVVTGGNGGLGLGMAEGLAQCGATVAIWGRNPDKTAAAAEALGAHAFAVDVSDRASIDAAMAATLAKLGRVDAMFANAGVSTEERRVGFLDRSDAEWDRLMRTNVDGVRWCFQAAGRHMVDRARAGDRFGRLVATSSVASLDGTPFNEHYAASKAALNAIIRALAIEFARHGITANAILPGFCESEMTQEMLSNDKFTAAVMPRIPVRRFGTAADFRGIAAYLASPASAYHTGQCFTLDGGYTIF